jgi:hypothetical protein
LEDAVVTWLLALMGIILVVLGLWGGPRRRARAVSPPAEEDAWQVLNDPIRHDEDELIKIPPDRPWYQAGRESRFAQGLLTGLGVGLIISAFVLMVKPVAEAPDGLAPAIPPIAAPAPTPDPPPPTPPPTPATVTIQVEPGDLAPIIAARLVQAGLIAEEELFLSRVAEREVDTLLKAGSFVIPTDATLDQVIDRLTA